MNFFQWLNAVCANLACGLDSIAHLAEDLHQSFSKGEDANDVADSLIARGM